MHSAARTYIPFDFKKLFLLNELSIISASFLRVRCHGVFSFLFLTVPPRFMRKAKFMKNKNEKTPAFRRAPFRNEGFDATFSIWFEEG